MTQGRTHPSSLLPNLANLAPSFECELDDRHSLGKVILPFVECGDLTAACKAPSRQYWRLQI